MNTIGKIALVGAGIFTGVVVQKAINEYEHDEERRHRDHDQLETKIRLQEGRINCLQADTNDLRNKVDLMEIRNKRPD